MAFCAPTHQPRKFHYISGIFLCAPNKPQLHQLSFLLGGFNHLQMQAFCFSAPSFSLSEFRGAAPRVPPNKFMPLLVLHREQAIA